jgi:hypothetical protein
MSAISPTGQAGSLAGALVGLDLWKQRLAAGKRFFRPHSLPLIVLLEGRSARGENDPRLLRRGEDMDVWSKCIRIVQGANADEGDNQASAGVMRVGTNDSGSSARP